MASSRKRATCETDGDSSSESDETYGDMPNGEEITQKISEDQKKTGERRQLRIGYRKLINDLHGMGIEEDEDGNITHEPVAEQSAAKIREQLELVELLYSQVTHTREAALDSQVYRLIASNAEQKVQSLHSELISFVPDEFAEKLITYLGVDRASYPNSLSNQAWEDLGKTCVSMFKTATTLCTFSGSFEPTEVLPKEKPKRRPRMRTDENSSQKPTLVQQIPQSENLYEEKTTEEVENVYQTLQNLYRKNENEPLCYFRFVIDPDSFSRTVENIFYTSFLIKDGNAKIFYDDFELPVIMPIDKETQGEATSDRYALALGISSSEWMELKSAFNITQGVISRKKK